MKREVIVLLNLTLLLVCVGTLMVYSATTAGQLAGGVMVADTLAFLRPQLIHLAFGVTAFLFFLRFDYHRFQKRFWLYGISATACVLLGLVLLFGVEKYGARRWLEVAGFQFQPSEFAKLAVIVWLAVRLSENQHLLDSFWRGFALPAAAIAVVAALIAAENDLGAPVVIGFVGMVMIMVAGVRWRHLMLSAAAGTAAVAALIVTSSHRMERLTAWRNPWDDPNESGYQLIQSLAAFARGGLWGQGAGASQQKLGYLPFAESDFSFAIWGEEMGLVGSLLLVVVFLGVIVVGLRVARCAQDLLGALLATGIVTLIGLQAAMNMAVTTGMMPTKGLPLPFVSAGGSALLVNLALMGVLLNVAMHARDEYADSSPGLVNQAA